MTSRVRAAFRAVPREGFLPDRQRRYADVDAPLTIGHGATNSQPSTVAYMLELLDVRPGDRVLDVGSGSGWTTALLAELVGPGGSVVGVEIVDALVAMGRGHLAGRWPWARIVPASPGVLGLPDEGPFDRILVSADGGDVPAELEEQLADGGRMVLPAAHSMIVVDRSPDSRLRRHTAEGMFSFVPLR